MAFDLADASIQSPFDKLERDEICRLALALLKITRTTERVPLDSVLSQTMMTRKQVFKLLNAMDDIGLLQFNNDIILLTLNHKLNLARFAVANSVDLTRVTELLSWQDFENLVEYALRSNGYQTVKGLNLRLKEKRFQIDVLGILNDLVIAVDCKHWKHGATSSKLTRTVNAQLVRCKMFASLDERELLQCRQGLTLPRTYRILPVIVMLFETYEKIHNGVPVVSIMQFDDFILQLPSYIDSLSFIDTSRKNSVLVIEGDMQ